jgi:hypothetical protein
MRNTSQKIEVWSKVCRAVVAFAPDLPHCVGSSPTRVGNLEDGTRIPNAGEPLQKPTPSGGVNEPERGMQPKTLSQKIKLKQKETNKMSETWHYPPTHDDPRNERIPISNEAYEQLEREFLQERAAKDAERKKALESQPKPQYDHVVELSLALEALENSVIDYQQNKDGRPNVPLIEARNRVVLLQAELDSAIKELQAEEAKGSWIDQLDAEIRKAETALLHLTNDYSTKVSDDLVRGLIGKSNEFKTAPSEIKAIVRHHDRLHVLRKFNLAGREPLPQRLGPDGRIVTDKPSLEFLYDRAEQVAKKLDELRSHIAAEEQERP